MYSHSLSLLHLLVKGYRNLIINRNQNQTKLPLLLILLKPHPPITPVITQGHLKPQRPLLVMRKISKDLSRVVVRIIPLQNVSSSILCNLSIMTSALQMVHNIEVYLTHILNNTLNLTNVLKWD